MSTEPYVPSLSMMRAAWKSYIPDESGEGREDAEFDRFVAKVRADERANFALTRENIRKIKAEAWFEGHRAGYQEAQGHHTMGDGCGPDWWDCDCPNPYLEQEEA